MFGAAPDDGGGGEMDDESDVSRPHRPKLGGDEWGQLLDIMQQIADHLASLADSHPVVVWHPVAVRVQCDRRHVRWSTFMGSATTILGIPMIGSMRCHPI